MSIYVVADTEGHAVAVVPTMADAYKAAGAEAHRVMEDLAASGGDDLVWTIETRERTPQWTRLTAFTVDRTSMVTYVVTEIDGATDGTFVQAADRSASPIVGTAILAAPSAAAVEPVEPVEPVDAEPAAGDAPYVVPEPQAAPEPPEMGVPDLPECSAHHPGCAGHVETPAQLELCNYKRLPPLCINCLKVEVAAKNGDDPVQPEGVTAPEPDIAVEADSEPVADA